MDFWSHLLFCWCCHSMAYMIFRKDWNLLSTATPAINAWMSPFDRLMTAVRSLVQELTHRTNSVMACMMTEGLEVQSIHMPLKVTLVLFSTNPLTVLLFGSPEPKPNGCTNDISMTHWSNHLFNRYFQASLKPQRQFHM